MYEVREGHDSDNREELDELWECVERMKKKIKMFEKVARRLMDGDFGERDDMGDYYDGDDDMGERRGVRGTGRYSRVRRRY